MREILFRGKRKDNGEWVEGDLNYLHTGSGVFIAMRKRGDFCQDVIPETVGQYTGLTDKNGKKIFEGDIVKCNKWEYGRKPMYGHIVYGTCCFCVQDINSQNNPAMDLCHDFKVIGNIHDNPELLEVKK